MKTHFDYGKNIPVNDFQTLAVLISELPGPDGWWKSDSQDVFENNGKRLLNIGFAVEEAFSILEDIYYAVSAEYGN